MVSRYNYGLKNPNSVWSQPPVEAGCFDEFTNNDSVIKRSERYNLSKFSCHKKIIVDNFIRVESTEKDLSNITKK